eukprot:5722597-Amphidinium_carterae.5
MADQNTEDHSGVIRLAIRMSCVQEFFFVMAVMLGLILGRVTGEEAHFRSLQNQWISQCGQ